MRRTLDRSNMVALWLVLSICLSVGTPPHARADITYDYTGAPFDPTKCGASASVTCPSGEITGSATLSIPSGYTGNAFASQLTAYSFSAPTGVSVAYPPSTAGEGQIDADFSFLNGSITGAQFDADGSNGVILITRSGDESAQILTVPQSLGISDTPGTWTLSGGSSSGGGSGPPPPPPGPSLYLSVETDPHASTQSLSLNPTQITAELTLATTPPPDSMPVPLAHALASTDMTLQDAAHDLRYLGFDWLQTLSGPDPLPYYKCLDPSCSGGDSPPDAEIIGSTLDPPQQYGFDYCNPSSQNFTGEANCVHQYYYDPTIAENLKLSADPDTGCIHYEGGCVTTLTDMADTTLNYFDSSKDPCLTNQASSLLSTSANIGDPSPAYMNNTIVSPKTSPLLTAQDRCQGKTASGDLSFKTELIGLTATGYDVLDTFNWIDTFNGLSVETGTGGISISPISALDADPLSGTGGIRRTQIAEQTVPEPSSIILVISYICIATSMIYWSRCGKYR